MFIHSRPGDMAVAPPRLSLATRPPLPDDDLSAMLLDRVLMPLARFPILFRAQVGQERLIVIRFGLWRREYLWRSLQRVSDAGRHHHELTFAPGGRLWLPKDLVGMPGLRRFLIEVLDRNAAIHARIARG